MPPEWSKKQKNRIFSQIHPIPTPKAFFDQFQNYLKTEAFLVTFNELIEQTYSGSAFTIGIKDLLSNFIQTTIESFSNIANLKTILKQTSDGSAFTLELRDSISVLFKENENGISSKLKVENLPEGTMLYENGNWNRLRDRYQNLQHELGGVYVMVHSKENGQVINGIMKVEDVVTKLPENIFEGYYDSRNVYHDIYLSDAEGTYLYSRIAIKDINGNLVFKIREENWYKSFSKTQGIERTIYTAFGITSGDQHIFFLQETVVAMEQGTNFQRFLPQTEVKSKSRRSDFDTELPHLIFGPLQENTQIKIDLINDIVYQFSHAHELYGSIGASPPQVGQISHSFDFAPLLKSEGILQLHRSTRSLPDGSEVTYTKEYIKSVLDSLNTDSNLDLSKISWFFIKNGEFDQANDLELKEFYQEFLDRIRERISAGDPLFTEFKNVLENSLNFDIGTDSFTKDEERLLSNMRISLNTIFGYTGFTLLQMGIMVFNEIDGNFEVDFIIPPYKTLTKNLNKFKIRPLNTKAFASDLGLTYLNDLRNRPGMLFSMLFSGHMQMVPKSSTDFNYLYSYLSLDLIKDLFPEYESGVDNAWYHSLVNNMFLNRFYSSYAGSEAFGQRIADAKSKLLDLIFTKIVDVQITLKTLRTYSPFNSMNDADQRIWVDIMKTYYKIALADAIFFPQKGLDPTTIIFDMITGKYTSDLLKTKIAGNSPQNNKFARTFELNFGVLLSQLTKEEIRKISPALYFTYTHLKTDSDAKVNVKNYAKMTTDLFWNLVEAPIEHTVTQLGDILTTSGQESFVVQLRRISHRGLNKDKDGLLKSQVYDSSTLDFNEHPEIAGTNILITANDLGDAATLRQKLFSIVYYMVKYQASFVIKEGSAASNNVVLAGNLQELFNLDKIVSLTSGGDWGTLTLTNAAEYNTWQQNWNIGDKEKKKIWTSANAFIPFYLFPDYKSNINSFLDDDGNVLTEGRLKELFAIRFGVDIEYLTTQRKA